MLIEQQNDNKFFSLNSIINGMGSLFSKKTPEEIAMQALREKVQEYIDTKNFSFVFGASQHGYVFTQKQADQLSDMFTEYMSKHQMDDAATMVKLGYKLNDGNIHTLFFNSVFQAKFASAFYSYYTSGKDKKAYDDWDRHLGGVYSALTSHPLANAFLEYQDNSENSKKLFDAWCKRMPELVNFSGRNKEYAITTDVKHFRGGNVSLIAYMSINHTEGALGSSQLYQNTINTLEKMRDDAKKKHVDSYDINMHNAFDDKRNVEVIEFIMKNMNHKLQNYFKDELNDLISKTRGINMSERVVLNIQKNLQLQQYNVKNLPGDASNQLKEIEDCYITLQAHTSKMTQQQKFECDNLIDKRLPQVLQKYFNIDEEYRTKLKTIDGETPTDLLLASLQSINENIHELQLSLNEQHMQELQVSKKYLNGLRKN